MRQLKKWSKAGFALCLMVALIGLFSSESATAFQSDSELALNIPASTQLVVQLPFSIITDFYISDGRISIGSRLFRLTSEQHHVHFEVVQDLLIVTLTVPQDSTMMVERDVVSNTRVDDRPSKEEVLAGKNLEGNVILTYEDRFTVFGDEYTTARSFTYNDFHLKGYFDVLSVDNTTDKLTNLLDLEINATVGGKLIFRRTPFRTWPLH